MNRTAGRPAGAGGDYADEFITKIGSRRTVLAGSTLVLLFLLLLWWQIGRWYESQVVAETRVNLAVDVGLRGNALAALLNRRFCPAAGAHRFCGDVTAETDVEENFAAFAARLYDETQGVRSFSLAPGARCVSSIPWRATRRCWGSAAGRSRPGFATPPNARYAAGASSSPARWLCRMAIRD